VVVEHKLQEETEALHGQALHLEDPLGHSEMVDKEVTGKQHQVVVVVVDIMVVVVVVVTMDVALAQMVAVAVAEVHPLFLQVVVVLQGITRITDMLLLHTAVGLLK